MTQLNSTLAPERRVSRTESRVLEALRRRDRTTGRPRDWLDLRRDKTWLAAEVGTPHLRQLLDRMAGKGSLFQLGGGRYVVAPRGSVDVSQALPFSVALDVAMGGREYYLAFGSALADHGLIDENVDPIIAARASAVGGNDVLSVQGLEVTIVRVSSVRRWLGRERVKGETRSEYWRSDLERTLLDAVDRPDLCAGNELVARAWERAVHAERLDTDRLVDYATRLGGVSALRAAFYSQQLDQHDLAKHILAVVPRTRSSTARLDVTGAFGPGKWPRDRATGLQINIPEPRLRGWLSYGK
jgi:predicted transcriptional regulator of viral defense system